MQRLQSLQCLRAALLRPACRHRRSVSFVVRAAGEDEVEPWQVTKLQQALASAGGSRRQVKVEELCRQAELPRQTVLQWLKDAPTPDRTEQSLQGARLAAEVAAAERQALLEEAQTPGGGRARSDGKRRQEAGGSRQTGPRVGPGGQPIWKTFPGKKKLGKQAEATLEMLYTRTQWPSDEAVSSLWDLHRLPRDRVVEWFQQRRRRDQRRLGSGGSAPQGGPAAAPPRSSGARDAPAEGAAAGGGGVAGWDEWTKE